MRSFYFCDRSTCEAVSVLTAADTASLNTSNGMVQADAITAASQASLTAPGADVNGDVLYTSKLGGLCMNGITVAHAEGDTGIGHESRALAAAWADKTLTVTFGTDGAGASVVPTAAEIQTVVNALDPCAVTASLPGTGASVSALMAQTPLVGGNDDGTWLKFAASGGPMCHMVGLVEVI